MNVGKGMTDLVKEIGRTAEAFKYSAASVGYAPCGPSSTDFNVWLAENKSIDLRLEKAEMSGIGYEIWRQAWMSCERYHKIRS